MNGYDDEYDIAQICLHGHIVNDRTHEFPHSNAQHCSQCGARTITQCQTCGIDIRGPEFGFEHGLDSSTFLPPPFCHACGKPYPWTEKTKEANLMPPRIFVSHSSNDAELVTALVDLLEKAFSFVKGDIRCTSLPGYGLESGAHTSTTLQQELRGSQVVLGVLSESGRHSDWVLFELGAAWGMGKRVIPMLFGTDYRRDLPGPLAEQNAVNASNHGKVSEMVETVKKALGLELKSIAIVNEATNKLVQVASQLGMQESALEDKSRPSLDPFVERHGVLWKRESSGRYEDLTYCPSCKLAMFEFPPGSNEMLICSKCNFVAPFRPNELKSILSKLS